MVRLADHHALLILLALFACQVVLVSPNGEFPLNDDWVHSWTIHQYAWYGEVSYPSVLAAYNYAPIALGAVAAKAFGFSFELLRWLNLILAGASVLLFYQLCRRLRVGPLLSFAASVLLWANPLLFNLSYTAMADVLFVFLLLLAMYYYVLGFEYREHWYLLIATSVTLLAFFTRQSAILLFVPALVAYLFEPKFRSVKGLWAFGIPIGWGLAAQQALAVVGWQPLSAGVHQLPEGWSYTAHALRQLLVYSFELIVFVAPLVVAAFARNLRWLLRWQMWLLLAVGSLVGGYLAATGLLLVQPENIVNQFGLGPIRTVLQGELQTWGPIGIYQAVTVIAAILAGLAGWLVWQQRKAFDLSPAFWLIFVFGILSFFAALPIRSFDRYLLPVLPVMLLVLVVLLREAKWSSTIFALLALPLFFYSSLGTYNYLAWNRARWEVGTRLLTQPDVIVENIEGGYEWNGWYIYPKHQGRPFNEYTPDWAPWYVKEYAPGHWMEYIISFSPLGGYEVVDQEPVKGLWSNIDQIHVNKVLSK